MYEKEISLKDGAKELIHMLKEEHMPLGIATSNSRELAKVCLKSNGILDAFDYICTSDEVPKGKPEPDVLSSRGRKNCRWSRKKFWYLRIFPMDLWPANGPIWQHVPSAILTQSGQWRKNSGWRIIILILIMMY